MGIGSPLIHSIFFNDSRSLIRLQGCKGWSGPSFSAHARRHVYAWCGSNGHRGNERINKVLYRAHQHLEYQYRDKNNNLQGYSLHITVPLIHPHPRLRSHIYRENLPCYKKLKGQPLVDLRIQTLYIRRLSIKTFLLLEKGISILPNMGWQPSYSIEHDRLNKSIYSILLLIITFKENNYFPNQYMDWSMLIIAPNNIIYGYSVKIYPYLHLVYLGN